MSGKRRNQQQQYGARRMTKAYQLNMMVEEREKEKKAQESAKRQKYLSIGGTIAFTVVLIVCIIQSWLIPGIIVGCGFAGFAVYIYLHGRKMQKESIMHMKEQGYTKRMLLQMLERRGEKQSTIDLYNKLWDKYNKPKAAAK